MHFSHKMPVYFFYTMVQKRQKWPKTQIKLGGPALNISSKSPYSPMIKHQIKVGASGWVLFGWNHVYKHNFAEIRYMEISPAISP